jgi:hypothetical protein
MLRLLMLIAAAIVVLWVAAMVVHFLLWLFMLGMILFVIALVIGVFRVGRWSGGRRKADRF